MKNIAAFILSIALVVAAGFGLSSCKDDDPPARPKLSFAETAISVNEDDGNVEVELILDKPHSKTLRIEFSLGGTASDQEEVGTAGADYKVVGDHDAVEIPAGQTSGTIEFQVYADAAFEEDETIEIRIVDTNTDEIEVTADDEVEITIVNDDAALQLSFASQSITVNEADQGVEVKLNFDKPAPVAFTLNYTLSGTAIDSVTAWNQQTAGDYYINSETPGQLPIAAGQTTATIDLRLFSDLVLEDGNNATEAFEPEKIIITVTPSANFQIATNTTEILVEQEDGVLIALLWPDPVAVAPGDTLQADMDLLLRVGANTSTWDGFLTGSIAASFEAPELVFIPFAAPYTAYGLSYVYYEGTLDPLEFEAVFIEFIDGNLEPQADVERFAASYTAVNKNPWDPGTGGAGLNSTLVVQTFEKQGGVFTAHSTIAVPNEGSRVRSRDNFVSKIRKGELRHAGNLERVIRRYR